MTENSPPIKVMIVDDSASYCKARKRLLLQRFGSRVEVSSYQDPQEALDQLGKDFSLILVDWLMPGLDGREFLRRALEKGIDSKRIVILSGKPADFLHEEFPLGECLAVIEKGDLAQEEALFSIVKEITESAA
ncbi:MAG: response regulator [Deltaproteobacteria bacterium]|nr:response regulator [Deltaproteobacteria bacterium]MBI2501215.1 response regulator [Deltaproteobacteria bacterium]